MPVFDPLTMQWVASTTLTVASIVVAVVAAAFSYRQKKPVILVLTQQFGEDAWIKFEFWNRRKYPIVVHGAEIKFGNVMLDQEPPNGGEDRDWYVWHNKLCQREHIRLEPASHQLYEASVPIKKQTLSESEIVRIDVFYFDPIANRRKRLIRKHRYRHTQEGD